MSIVILSDLQSELEWQLAYLAHQHGEDDKIIHLEYEVPDGTAVMAVEKEGNLTKVWRERDE